MKKNEKEKLICNKNNNPKNFFGIFGIFCLFIISGFIFRYLVEILDSWKSLVLTKMGLCVEDINRENHKRWSILTAEYPIKQEVVSYDDGNAIGFHVNNDYDDIEEYEDFDE